MRMQMIALMMCSFGCPEVLYDGRKSNALVMQQELHRLKLRDDPEWHEVERDIVLHCRNLVV